MSQNLEKILENQEKCYKIQKNAKQFKKCHKCIKLLENLKKYYRIQKNDTKPQKLLENLKKCYEIQKNARKS